jgi:hypothetical protein
VVNRRERVVPAQKESLAEDTPSIQNKVLKVFNGGEKHDDEQFTAGNKPGPGQLLLAINVDSFDGQLEWTLRVEDANKNVLDEVHSIPGKLPRSNTWGAEMIFCALTPPTVMQCVRFPRLFPPFIASPNGPAQHSRVRG